MDEGPHFREIVVALIFAYWRLIDHFISIDRAGNPFLVLLKEVKQTQ